MKEKAAFEENGTDTENSFDIPKNYKPSTKNVFERETILDDDTELCLFQLPISKQVTAQQLQGSKFVFQRESLVERERERERERGRSAGHFVLQDGTHLPLKSQSVSPSSLFVLLPNTEETEGAARPISWVSSCVLGGELFREAENERREREMESEERESEREKERDRETGEAQSGENSHLTSTPRQGRPDLWSPTSNDSSKKSEKKRKKKQDSAGEGERGGEAREDDNSSVYSKGTENTSSSVKKSKKEKRKGDESGTKSVKKKSKSDSA